MAVYDECGVLRRVAVCEPRYFKLQGINEISRRLIGKKAPSPEVVRLEHERLVQAYISAGVEVVRIPAVPHFPCQVSVRDCGVMTRSGMLVGHFRLEVRRGEEIAAEKAVSEHEVIWRRVADAGPGTFEGGDFMYVDSATAALGVGPRTDWPGAEIVKRLCSEIGVQVIPVAIAPQWLHLDLVFNVVAEKVCVICSEALPQDFLELVGRREFERVEIRGDEAMELAGNLVGLGDGRVLSSGRNKAVNRRLEELGLTVLEVDVCELFKVGTGLHCMTFPLTREPAGRDFMCT